MKPKNRSDIISRILKIFTISFIVISSIAILIFLSSNKQTNLIEKYKNSTIFYTILFLYICYSIPFLWNVYEKIINIRDLITEHDIDNVISREYYKIKLNNYHIYLNYPIILIIFFTLFILPILIYPVGIFFIMISALFFFFLPQIYQFTKYKSYKSFKNFLKKSPAASFEIQEAFRELWSKKEPLLINMFFFEEKDLFDIFKQKIYSLIENNSYLYLQNYLKDFLNFIQLRSNLFLLNNTTLFFLKLHKSIWGKKNKELLYTIENILDYIISESLKNKRKNDFPKLLKYFKNHYQKETSEEYIQKITSMFTQCFFKTIENNKISYEWNKYIPENWKVTDKNLRDELSIPKFILNNFMVYFNNMIYEINNLNDIIIDNLVKVFFPEVYPNLFIRLSVFALYKPLSKNDKIKIENIENIVVNFNSFGVSGYKINNKKNFFLEKNIDEMSDRYEKLTFDIIKYTFTNIFSDKNIKKYIKTLKKLKDKYSDDSNSLYNLNDYINIFNKMIKYNK